MTTNLLLPLLNRDINIFEGPTLYLSDKVSIEIISTEDYDIILSYAPDEYKSLFSMKSICIKVEGVDEDKCVDIARVEGTKIAFLLNYFKGAQPIAISFAAQITKSHEIILERIIELPFVSDVRFQRDNDYHIRNNVPREYISQFYQVISKVHEKHPGILMTLDRFNSALYRTVPYDKIIDITISLESLISGTTELRHRFSLYNAWIAEQDLKNRKRCFDLLRSVYDARSAIVHGTLMTEKEHEKKINSVLKNWDDITRVAGKVIAYHLLYLYANDIKKWYQHQVKLALGIEKRII